MQKHLRMDEGWSTLLLVWAMILLSSFAIMQADLTEGLHILPIVASFAVFAGLFLAKSRFSPNTAHLISLTYGLFVIFYVIGVSFPEQMTWRERVLDMLVRQVEWLRKAFGGGTSRDGLIFVIQTSAIFWLLGYTASWYTFRHPHVWRASVPAGVVLLSVVYYYAGPVPLPLYLAAYIILALVYVARTHLVAQEVSWRQSAVRYERGIRFSFMQAGFLAAVAALLISWSMPTLSANAAVNDALSGTKGPWREFQDNWTRLFAALRAYGAPTSDPYQDTLVMGGPRTVGDTVVMDVLVPRQLSNPYWQAVVWQAYDDRGWHVAEEDDVVLRFPDDGVLNPPFASARQVITQTVINYLPNSALLYGAPEVIGSDRQMFITLAKSERGDDLITAVRSRFVLRPGDRYLVVSNVSVADAQSLRETSTVYPTWVSERYLQLADNVTPDLRNLAAELTDSYNNSYDKALAIQGYLRETIRYNDQIQAPPDGVDPIHYVLFVSQEGYCNYYAGAMTLMLRSVGIPARIVSGYAQGQFDEASQSYRVRASNAHTWVEVYFPDYGWIQFEPTASLPVVARPETSDEGAASSSLFFDPPPVDRDALLGEDPLDDVERGGDAPEEFTENGAAGGSFWANFPIWQVLGAVLILAVAGGALYGANELNKRVEGDVERSYGRLAGWARWLGIGFRPVHTPYERADLLTTAVPEGKNSIRNLTQQFVLKQFSPAQSPDSNFNPINEWSQLRPLLLRQSILHTLQERQKKKKRR